MTEFYNEHGCDCHIHPQKDPIEDLLMFVANYYTSLLTKLRNHINDTSAGHVTAEEKDYWNNKADKIALRDLEEMLINLKNKVNNLEDTILDNVKQWIKNKKYITEDDMVSYVTNQINKIVAGEIDLSGYAKESWVLELIAKITGPGGSIDLSKYALKTDLDALKSTVTNIDSRVTNIENGGGGKDYKITSVDVTGQTLTITQNNMGFKSVTLPSGSGSGTTSGISKSEVESMLKDAKTLIIKRNGTLDQAYNPFTSANDITIDIVSGGSSGGDGSSSRYKAFFQNTNSYDVAPAVPDAGKGPENYDSTDERSKWIDTAKNPSKGYYTWMTFAYLSNGVYGSWTTPVRITGKDGEAGTDTTDKEQIYRLAGEGEIVLKPNNKEDEEDYVPDGWKGNPQGVSKEAPCEWTCVRTKNSATNKWSDWTNPVLWSHYGHNGTDGDGVEYIYWAGYNAPTDDPSIWYDDSDSKAGGSDSNGKYSVEDGSDEYYNTKFFNKREYIKAGSDWKDDPIDLSDENSNYGLGAVQYVSIRKYRKDKESEEAYWHTYSTPKLWSYYPNDGAMGDSVKLQLDNQVMGVPVGSDGYNAGEYNALCHAYFYNGLDSVALNSLEIISVRASNGNSVDQNPTWLSISGDTIVVNLGTSSNDRLYLSDVVYTVTVRGTASTGGTSGVTRDSSFLITGVRIGEDGASYSLKVGSSTIAIEDGTRYPSKLQISCIKTKGEDVKEILPSNTNSGFTFEYSVDDGDWTTLTKDELSASIISSIKNFVVVRLKYNNVIVDQQLINVVKSGLPGANGVTYGINVKSTTVTKNSDNTISGDITFTVYKSHDTGVSELPSSTTGADECSVCTATVGQSDSVKIDWRNAEGDWKISLDKHSVPTNDLYIFIKAYLYENGENGRFLASTVVPVIIPGPAGSSTVQTLKGSPLRILGAWEKGKKYYDGKRDAEDGVKYQDIVLYNNGYYLCVNTEAGESDKWNTFPNAASYWTVFGMQEDFVVNTMIANKAVIKELSSNEVVIMDDNAIVAGMTSSNAIDNNSDLHGKVTSKGDVRIWAGEISNGNLSTAPFTVDKDGKMTATNVVFKNDCGNTYITSGKQELIEGSLVTMAESAGFVIKDSTNTRNVILLTSQKFYVDGNESILPAYTPSLIISSQEGLYTQLQDGYLYLSGGASLHPYELSLGKGNAVISTPFANNAVTKVVLKSLPTSDPKNNGLLYRDASGNLKVSLG